MSNQSNILALHRKMPCGKRQKKCHILTPVEFDAVSHDILLINFRKCVLEEAVITDVRNNSEKIMVTID